MLRSTLLLAKDGFHGEGYFRINKLAHEFYRPVKYIGFLYVRTAGSLSVAI